jgi:lipoprotein-releasing system permease protein
MKIGSVFFTALKLLRGRPESTENQHVDKPLKRAGHSGGLLGATLGIGISMIPIVLVLVVSDGMIQGITDRYIATKTWHLQVSLPSGMGQGGIEKGKKALESIHGVKSVIHEQDGSALAMSGNYSHGVMLRAIDLAFFSDHAVSRYLSATQGRLSPRGDHDIVLGSALAAELHVAEGSSLTLLTTMLYSPKNVLGVIPSTGFGGFAPKISIFRVTGIVDAGYRDLDSLWAFITPGAGRNLISNYTGQEYFALETNDPYSASLARIKNETIIAMKNAYPDWFEPYFARTWTEIESNLYKSFSTTKSLLIYIMGIALLVAAINLSSALYTFSLEHRIDIAVLSSFGTTDSQILKIFLIGGFLIGTLGTILGSAVGILLSINVNGIITAIEWIVNAFASLEASMRGIAAEHIKILDPAYYLAQIPVTVHWGQIAVLVAAGITLCVLIVFLPAKKAMKSSPLELMRKV